MPRGAAGQSCGRRGVARAYGEVARAPQRHGRPRHAGRRCGNSLSESMFVASSMLRGRSRHRIHVRVSATRSASCCGCWAVLFRSAGSLTYRRGAAQRSRAQRPLAQRSGPSGHGVVAAVAECPRCLRHARPQGADSARAAASSHPAGRREVGSAGGGQGSVRQPDSHPAADRAGGALRLSSV